MVLAADRRDQVRPPKANPYYDPNCDPHGHDRASQPQIPAVPDVSMGMEAFNDTPTGQRHRLSDVDVEPKSYRFRILNAADDRFFNLQLYKADSTGTEVALDPADGGCRAGRPDRLTRPRTPTISTPGPSWIQIGTEGGFLPTPVSHAQPADHLGHRPDRFNAGNVDKHSLLVGPAERADVIVDFSKYAGQTLILYNDAPAAFPARDPRYDYYTGNADLTDYRRRPDHAARLRPEHPHRHADQGRRCAGRRCRSTTAGCRPRSPHSRRQRRLRVVAEPDRRRPGRVQRGLRHRFRTAAPDDGFVRIFDANITFKTLERCGGSDADTSRCSPRRSTTR